MSGFSARGFGTGTTLPSVDQSKRNIVISAAAEFRAEPRNHLAVLAGSPTMSRGILSVMSGILEEISGLRFKEKKAAAFGWSGESNKVLAEILMKAGFDVVDEGHKCLGAELLPLWIPRETRQSVL